MTTNNDSQAAEIRTYGNSLAMAIAFGLFALFLGDEAFRELGGAWFLWSWHGVEIIRIGVPTLFITAWWFRPDGDKSLHMLGMFFVIYTLAPGAFWLLCNGRGMNFADAQFLQTTGSQAVAVCEIGATAMAAISAVAVVTERIVGLVRRPTTSSESTD
jgi:hypothetical protein